MTAYRGRPSAVPSGRLVLRVTLLALIGVWLLVLRPVSLGGPAGYIVVAGQSMLPGLPSEALVLTMPAAAYERGDVIAFRVADTSGSAPLVIHRIVGGSAATGFRTQGDNMAVSDPWLVLPEQIAGRQVAVVPEGGRLVALLRSPIVLATLAAGMATYLLLGRLPARRENLRPATQAFP